MKNKVGIEIIGDLKDCNYTLLTNLTTKKIQRKISQLIKTQGLHELGSYYYQFDVGATGVIALAESHLAIHTWPNEGYVSLSIYVCNYSQDNSKKAQEMFTQLVEFFKPEKVKFKEIKRNFR